MSATAIAAAIGGVFLLAALGEGWALKRAWQAQAAEEQALTQATTRLKELEDAAKERTGVDSSCSGLTLDQLIDRLRKGTPCS